MLILNIIRGMVMAFADSVPGVSGGTVAFVMGFYSEFINSINILASRNSIEEKKKALIFLLKLGIGWVGGFLLSVLFIASLFETHIYNISSLFLGFILFSLPIIYREEKQTITGNSKHIIYAIIGIVIVALITYFNPVSNGGGVSISINHFSIGMAIYMFFVGMIAISAMVLPGISGSTLLLIFGLYAPIIAGIKTLLGFDFSPFPLLFCFGLGVLAGAFTSIRVISHLLETKRSQLIFLIFGLMLGSLYAVVMGPTTLEVPQPPMSFSTFSILFFVLGGVIIFGLEKAKDLMK